MSKEIIDLWGKDTSRDTLLFSLLDFLRTVAPAQRSAVVAGIFDPNTEKFFVATSFIQGIALWQPVGWALAALSVVVAVLLFLPKTTQAFTRASQDSR